MVTEVMPEARSAALGYWIGVGARDEGPGQQGVCHFLEHLLFKGTRDRSARQIAEAIDEVGGDLNAFTTKEYTAVEVRLLAEQAGLGLDLLADLVWSPALRPADVEAERSVVFEELLMAQDEPADLVHDLLAEAAFPGHPLGDPILGTEETVGAVSADSLGRFHAEWYRPDRVVVAAAGRVDHDQVVAEVERRCPPPPAAAAPPPRRPVGTEVVAERVVERDTEQAHLVLGVRTPGSLDDDRDAAEVLTQALGGGMSSRLFQEVREERGLAYSVYSCATRYSETGTLAFYAGTHPDHVDQVWQLFSDALDSVGSEGLTPRELAVARGQVRGSFLLAMEDSGARMHWLGRSQLVLGRVPTVDEQLGRIEAVTAADVARVGAAAATGARSRVAIAPS